MPKLRIKMVLSLAAVGGLLFVLAQGANYFANAHAKATWLKGFYQQAALAQLHAQQLTFPNFVAQAPVDGSQSARDRGSGWRIAYCSGAGSYYDYATGKTLQNARTCQKGINRFYWLPTLNSATVTQEISALQQLGWIRIHDASDPDEILLTTNDLLQGGDSDRGFMFRRNDGTYAQLIFWNRHGHDASYGSSDWCVYGPGCAALKRADAVHQYFMSVSVYAYRGYEQ